MDAMDTHRALESTCSISSEGEDDYIEVNHSSGIRGFQFEPLREIQDHNSSGSSSESDEPLSEGDERGASAEWCQCTHCDCVTLSRIKEHKCCWDFPSIKKDVQQKGVQCITEYGTFSTLCLNPEVLRNVLISLNSIRCDNWEVRPPHNRSLRWASYRQFTWWIHGHLGRRVRRVLPACVVHAIRKSFPAPDGEGYEPYASDSEDND